MAKPSKKSVPPKQAVKPKAEDRNGKRSAPPPKAKSAKPNPPAPKAVAKPATPPKSAAKPAVPEAPPLPKITKAEAELMGKILHLISETMAVEEASLTPNASFRDELQIDEIDIAELLMQTEIDFGLHSFSEADWDRIQTVDDFVQLVMKRVEAKRGRRK